jgi:archaemetzincin
MTRRIGSAPPIYLWWLGAEASPDGLLGLVGTHVERAFGLAVRRWRGAERPTGAFDARRGQTLSTGILEWLRASGPAPAYKLLGITDADLFIPILTFVYGEAQLGGRTAVVSTARLAPAGVVRDDDRLLAARLVKEAVHELGHTFGLVHCADARCVMSRSASLTDVDVKGAGLCQDCWTRYLDLREGTEEPS